MNLTQRRIDGLVCPAGRKDMLTSDDEVRGLAVRTMASGSKSFLVRYTYRGVKRRVPLGSCDSISLDAARSAARGILGEVAHGRDPAADRKKQAQEIKSTVTFGALIELWDNLHLKVNRRPRYRAVAVHYLRNTLASLLKRDVASISKREVIAIFDKLQLTYKPNSVRAAATYAHACCRWALKRGAITVNPFANLPLPSASSRDRTLTDDEIYRVWQATEDPRQSFNAIARMLLLTGQRIGEVTGMVWDELDDDLMVWTIPAGRSKNHKVQIVPLSPQAKQLILDRGQPPDAFSTNHVFRTQARAGRTQGFIYGLDHAKVQIDKKSGVTGWTFHDLRRTVATNLQRLGVRLEVTESVLGHVSGSKSGVVGIYQTYNWDAEKRAALDAWAKHLMAIVEGRPAPVGNVVTMKERKQKKTVQSA
jgi:integrase